VLVSDTTLAIELPGNDDLGVRRTTASRRLDAALSDDEDSWPPQVTALVVGAGRDPELDRLIEFLTTTMASISKPSPSRCLASPTAR